MAVRKNPEAPKEKVDVDALIEKGAKVKEDKIEESKQWTIINLRLPLDMLENIDNNVKERIGMTRTGWILEALTGILKKTP